MGFLSVFTMSELFSPTVHDSEEQGESFSLFFLFSARQERGMQDLASQISDGTCASYSGSLEY